MLVTGGGGFIGNHLVARWSTKVPMCAPWCTVTRRAGEAFSIIFLPPSGAICKISEVTSIMSDAAEVLILAGGRGERLLPHTQETPKPLVPVSIREKPTQDYEVSLGINVFDDCAVEAIEREEAIDMPHFVARLLKDGAQVEVWRTDCEWLDIGRPGQAEPRLVPRAGASSPARAWDSPWRDRAISRWSS